MKTSLLLAPVLMLGVATAACAAPGPRGGGDAPTTRAELAQKLDERFARLDANGDGGITTAEFAAAKAQRAERRTERDATNPDRAAKRGERRGGPGARGGERPNPDANGDGVVTRAEFGAPALARFAAADANNDGTVTKEERQAARQARRANRG